MWPDMTIRFASASASSCVAGTSKNTVTVVMFPDAWRTRNIQR